jgi:type IV pilus assembly protein PilV
MTHPKGNVVLPSHRKDAQQGMVLLEALIALLIFAFGILGLVGLQAASIKNVGDARFRVEAALLTDGLIAQMRTSDAATRAADFASPSGAKYAAWRNRVAANLPVPTTGADPVVDMTNYPEVKVTVYWRAPADTQNHQ